MRDLSAFGPRKTGGCGCAGYQFSRELSSGPLPNHYRSCDVWARQGERVGGSTAVVSKEIVAGAVESVADGLRCALLRH